jgi:hypothetical protein
MNDFARAVMVFTLQVQQWGTISSVFLIFIFTIARAFNVP